MLLRSFQFKAANLLSSFVDTDKMSALAKYMYVRKLLRKLEIELIIDVGANVGQFAQSMRQIGYRGLIVSFEPLPEVFAETQRTMAGDRRWAGFNMALGEREETLQINRSKSSIFSSFNLPTSEVTAMFDDENKVVEAKDVQVRRLDNVLTELNYTKYLGRTLLKVDTQGFEMQVLRGLGTYLRKLPAVQCEISSVPIYKRTPHMTEILAFLNENNFRPACFFPVSWMADWSVVEFDSIFINSFTQELQSPRRVELAAESPLASDVSPWTCEREDH
jgi:FkbM family methyltransferase